jgi:transposase InsO family protein
MQHVDLRPRSRQAWRPLTQSTSSAAQLADNVAQQDIHPTAPNRCWAGKINYIRTNAGWRYLAIWMDLLSRPVAG